MRTAILVDGAFFLKRYRALGNSFARDTPDRVVDNLYRWMVLHLTAPKARGPLGTPSRYQHGLSRIFYYDCPPLSNKSQHPLTARTIDFSRSRQARFRNRIHQLLKCRRKVALRLGRLADRGSWSITARKTEQLLKRKITIDDLCPNDVTPQIQQKGVDMRIGLDIASLAYKQQVDQIVLVAGDSDFVPAAKLARREGIDIVLDPMWQRIAEDLQEHIDGLRSTCPRPSTGPGTGPTGRIVAGRAWQRIEPPETDAPGHDSKEDSS